MQTNMLLHTCGNGNAAEKPKANPSATRRLPNGHAHRTAPRANARPRGKARRERPPTNPPSLAQYNLAQARIHKTARSPIVIKGNAMAIANAVELEDCRMGERVAKQRRLPAL